MSETNAGSENPFAPPSAEIATGQEPRAGVQQGLWREGNKLVVLKGSQLPPICVWSGEPAEQWLLRKFTWCPPALYLLIPFGGLIALILILVMQKKGEIYVPLTNETHRRRRARQLAVWGMILLALPMFVVGSMQALDPDGHRGLTIGMFIGFFVLLIASFVIGMRVSNLIRPTRITDQHMWFKGVHPNLLEGLEPWSGGSGKPLPPGPPLKERP